MKRFMGFAGCLILAAALAVSCSNSKTAFNDLKSFADKIENDSEDYTPDDWKEAAEEYAGIQEELAKYEYTAEELKEITKWQGICAGRIAKGSVKNVGKRINAGVKGFMKGISGD